MKTKSEILGTSTLGVEVSFISLLGIWMLIDGTEYYMPFVEYPWFRHAQPTQIYNVKRVSHDHFYWEELDIDLTLDMILNPQHYPLRSNNIL